MLIKTVAPKARTRIVAAALAAALLATGGCAMAPASEPVGSSSSPSPSQWQSILHRWRSRGDAPAAVLGIATADGATWVGADGTPERNGHIPIAADAPFRIASITK